MHVSGHKTDITLSVHLPDSRGQKLIPSRVKSVQVPQVGATRVVVVVEVVVVVVEVVVVEVVVLVVVVVVRVEAGVLPPEVPAVVPAVVPVVDAAVVP